MSFGQHLRRLRETDGLSRAELARRATEAAPPCRPHCDWPRPRGLMIGGLEPAVARGSPAPQEGEGAVIEPGRRANCLAAVSGSGRIAVKYLERLPPHGPPAPVTSVASPWSRGSPVECLGGQVWLNRAR